MPVLMTYGEVSTVIGTDLTKYLNSVGKTIGDITDAILMIKSDKTALDSAAEYQNTSPSYIGNEIKFNITDFSGLAADTDYFFAIGIRFSGDVTYRELKAKAGQDVIRFTQDLIRS